MKKLYLLRHGDIGGSGRYVGATDLPLSDLGMEEIRNVAVTLGNVKFDVIFCSPMQRCRQTLSCLDLQFEPLIDSDIREIDFGRWELKNFREIAAENGDLVDEWVNSPMSFSFPGGDSLGLFKKRIGLFLDKLVSCSGENILVVTHGGVIRYLLCLLLGLSLDNYLLFSVHTGTFATVELYSHGGVLTGFNLQ